MYNYKYENIRNTEALKKHFRNETNNHIIIIVVQLNDIIYINKCVNK